MRYFLDSAKIDEIRYAYQNWGIDGVTTNPKHIAATGKSFQTVIKELADEFKGKEFPISIEIDPYLQKSEEMITQAKKYAALSNNFVIKIPCTEQGLIAAKNLVQDGIKVNLTLVFTASQAIQAARIGCQYVSPFIGWQESSGADCSALVEDIVAIYGNYGYDSQIIVAAVRSGKTIVDAALVGADIVTAGFQIYKESFDHPFTDRGLKIFQEAWDQVKK
jgi:transaldolase